MYIVKIVVFLDRKKEMFLRSCYFFNVNECCIRIRVRAALRYGSTNMMHLIPAPVPQN
jgi:hypothetical protein